MLGDIAGKILKNDIEYINLKNKTKEPIPNSWLLKRIIKKAIYKIPFTDKAHQIVYFHYHYFRPSHIIKLAVNRFIKKEIYISFQHGFGDMLAAYPYFQKAKQKFPGHRTIAVIHSNKSLKYSVMQHSTGVFINMPDGTVIDYVKEFMETNPWVDEIIYDDCWKSGYIYGYPRTLEMLFGFAFDKKHFAKHKEFLFSAGDIDTAEKCIDAHGFKGKKLIAVHFKTAVNQLNGQIEKICSDSDLAKHKEDIVFVLFGKVENDTLELISSKGFGILNMSGSYGKGINTRQLIYIASKSMIFLGGRGGFNAVYYLLDIPAVNFFDDQGAQELHHGIWPESLWKENVTKRLIYETEDVGKVYEETVKPILTKAVSC